MEVQSAVRVPTPEPSDQEVVPDRVSHQSRKRKSPSFSRSPSPDRSRRPALSKTDGNRGGDRDRYLEERLKRRSPAREERRALTEAEKQDFARKELQRLQNARSGGTYIPPARLRALQAQITDQTSAEFQRQAWEALKKSINGLINKVNITNIKSLVGDLFQENLIRGRGLFCRSIMRAQAAALPFTPIYAALVCVTNTKIQAIGDLLVKRLVDSFRKGFRRNDKAVCISSTTFLAHLVNQQVLHEDCICEILLVLLSQPTDDSVEIAVGITKEVGQHLEEFNQGIASIIFDRFREVLHEGQVDKRTQYMIEVLFQVRREKYKSHPAIKEELDLVEEADMVVHHINTEDKLDTENSLNVFKEDPNYEENEEAYKKLKAEILGEDGSDDEYETDEAEVEPEPEKQQRAEDIQDQTNTNLTNLRRTIYLTINSSADFEEATHKLMKVKLPMGLESELPSMIIETCSQRPTYEKFYGLIGERFSKLNRLWRDQFETAFVEKYETIHRYETNRLRNVARFFGHILSTDAIGWHVLSVVRMNEEETTSSSRIFIKILFEDLAESMGMKSLQERLSDKTLEPHLEHLFPKDNPRNTRFSINYFTSIGMGPLTENMREFLKNVPTPAVPAIAGPSRARSDSVSSYSSYSSYTGSSRSYSSRSRSRSRSRSPPRRRASSRGRSLTRSDSRSRSPSYTPSASRSRSAPARRRRSPSYTPSRSRSRSPNRPRGRGRSYTPSRSPSYTPSRSRSPRGRGGRYDSASRSPVSRSRSPPPRSRNAVPARARASVSASPPPRSRAAARSRTPLSMSRSPRPLRSRRADSRSRSPSSRSRSPPPRSRVAARRPSYSPSPSRSRSVTPPSRRRSYSRSATPPLRDAARQGPPRRR